MASMFQQIERRMRGVTGLAGGTGRAGGTGQATVRVERLGPGGWSV